MSSTNPNLPSIKYFRDVGASINHISNRKLLKENILFISSSTKDASQPENEYLRNTLGIRTIIDTAWQSDRVVAPPTKPPSKDASTTQQPQSWLDIEDFLGLKRCGIKLRRGPYMDLLNSELSWWQRTKVFANALDENYERAIEMMTTAALAKGATNESLRVLEGSKVMIGELFNRIFGEEASYPILMQVVRDSNLFVIVLLLFLEVPIEVLEMDIERSVVEAQVANEPPKDEIGRKLQEDYVRSAGSWARDVERWVREKHRGVEGYLEAAGVTEKAREGIERELRVEGEKLVDL